jgi:hypothetical protein
VRELGPFVLLACACGAAVRAQGPARPAVSDEPPATSAAGANAGTGPDAGETAEATAAFDAMAARAASIAPGMREVVRKDAGPDAVDLVRAETRDVCVRVAYEATVPVVAKLVERSGGVLVAGDAPAAEGVLGARGPVCIRRGEVVRGMAEGAGARIRWMAWEAP